MTGVDLPVVLPEFQLQVVEIGLAEGVGPPQVRMLDSQLCERLGSEADLALLPGGERDRLLDLDVRFARPGDRRPQNAAHLLRRRVTQTAVDRQPRGIGSRERQFGVDRRRTQDHGAGPREAPRLPDARSGGGDKRIPVARILSRTLVSEIVSFYPLIPAVCQLDAVD